MHEYTVSNGSSGAQVALYHPLLNQMGAEPGDTIQFETDGDTLIGRLKKQCDHEEIFRTEGGGYRCGECYEELAIVEAGEEVTADA